MAITAAGCVNMPEYPPTPPTPGSDVTVAVSNGIRATIGSQVVYQATVSSVGTADTTGPVKVSVVVPVGQTVSAASGSGWTCTPGTGEATCETNASVPAGTALPAVSVTADVPALGSLPYLDSLSASVSAVGDVNPANDTNFGRVEVLPPGGSDELYVQFAGAYQFRVGGAITSGDVAINVPGLLPDRLTVNAGVGGSTISMNLTQVALTLFTGPVTVTDPRLPGGSITVTFRGDLRSLGDLPFRNLTGTQTGLRIPTLDVPGITGALAGGITFSLGITAVDVVPNPPAMSPPAMSYADNGSSLKPTINLPGRVVQGANINVGVQVTAEQGATIGPVAADIDLPADVTFVGPGDDTTCVQVPAIPGRVRCFLTSSRTSPIAPNVLGDLVSGILPGSGPPTINVRVQVGVAFQDRTIRAALGSGNSSTRFDSVTFQAKPPGADVGLSLTGPEISQALFLTEGTSISGNEYAFAVDNVGTATSSSPNVTIELPAGVTFRSFTTSGLTNPNRFTCTPSGQTVTCTRPNGVAVTSLLSPAPTFAVQVDVGPGPFAGAVTTTAVVTNANDVDPTAPEKSASSVARVAPAGAPQLGFTLSNGAVSLANRPVLASTLSTTVNGGRLDAISGCSDSRDFTPAVLAIPIVGPTLVPPVFADNQLCLNLTRVPTTNQFAGTVNTKFVAAPVFLPPPVPPEIPLPPVIPPRPISASAGAIGSLSIDGSGVISGSATGATPELVLNGGATYTTTWQLGPLAGVTCVDINLCP